MAQAQAIERQAKDGTFYRKVGQDEWEPVTRKAKDGTVYVKVGKDEWSPYDVWAGIGDIAESGPTASDQARAALEGFAESSSFGTLPYLKAAGEVATDWIAEKTLGVPMGNEPFEARVQKFREQGKDLQEKSPGFALAGQVAGFVAPGAGASRLVGKGLQVAAQAPGRIGQAAQAMSQAGRARDLYRAANEARLAGDAAKAAQLTRAARLDLAAQGGRLGLEGAALGAAYTPESGLTDLGARLEGGAVGFGTGAVLPAAFRGAENVVKGVGRAVPAAGKKLLSSLGGVSEDVIDRYLKDPERIRNAKTFDEIYEEVTGVVRNLFDDLDQKKINYDAAKAHLDDVARSIKESRIEGKARALEEVSQAKAVLDESFKVKKAQIADQASPTRLEPVVEDALRAQRERVSKGSTEAFEILEEMDAKQRAKKRIGNREYVDLQKAWNGLKRAAKEMNIGRSGTATPQAEAAQREILSLADTLGRLPAKLSFSEAKRVIQQIDRAERIIYDANAFTDEVSKAFQSVRRGLDEQLKEKVPEYAQKMAQVAEDTRIFSDAAERFGKDQTRLARLSNLGRPTAKHDLATLQNLVAREGPDAVRAVESMIEAQRTLRSPMRLEEIRRGLPEAQTLRQAEMQAAAAKRMAKPKAIQEAIRKSAAFRNARSAEANFKTAKDLANKFKSFGEQGAEAKLKQVAAGRKYATKLLKELSELENQDFVEAVNAWRDAAAFTKTAFHGSRNVNLFTVLGVGAQAAFSKSGLAGAAAGSIVGGPVGAALGATLGAMMDVYGPQVTKKILDGIIKIKGPLTPSAIRRMDLPETVKRDLIRQFELTVLSGRAAQKASESGRPKVAGDELDRDSSTPSQYRANE